MSTKKTDASKKISKENEYLAKLQDEDESEKESDTETESYEEESIEDDEDVEESEKEDEEESDIEDIDEDLSEGDDSGSEKKEQEDAPLEWIDDSVLEKTDKIILTGDDRVMSDRVTMNEFALITSMRIAQIEAGSPIFLDKNPYTSVKEIVLAEIRENANNKNGNYPLKILRHSHSNIYEEWYVREMSIPTIILNGTIIETGDDEQ
jgi:hypothetical protein